MPRSVGLAHIIRQPDGTSTGVWGVHTLKSAFQPIFAFGAEGKLSVAAFEGLIRPFRDGRPASPGTFFAGVPAAVVSGGVLTLVVAVVWWYRFPVLRGLDRFADLARYRH